MKKRGVGSGDGVPRTGTKPSRGLKHLLQLIIIIVIIIIIIISRVLGGR